jgi:hypothetical protein
MTERSTEPLNQSKEASVTEEEISGSGTIQSRRLESLLIDDSDRDNINALADREVIPVEKEIKTSSWLILSFLLTLSVTIGLAFIVFKFYSYSDTKIVQPMAAVEIKQPIPPRPSLLQPASVIQDSENKTHVEALDTVVEEIVSQDQEDIVLQTASPQIEDNLHVVVVGPFISSASLDKASAILIDLGLQAQKESGRGMVPMIRLQEGVYSSDQAQQRLTALKKIIKSAFLLPQGTKKVLYAGSFSEEDRALLLQAQLKQNRVDVKLVKTEIPMNGTLLIVLKADQQTAGQLAQHIKERGLNVQVKESR